MFRGGDFEEITKLAIDDVRGFFSHSFRGKFVEEKYHKLVDELRRLDPITFTDKFESPPESIIDFVEDLFVWLGKQFTRGASPWVKIQKVIDEKEYGEVYKIKSDEINKFLKGIRKWLDHLLGTSLLEDTSPSLDNKWKTGFADYMAKNNLPHSPWNEVIFTNANNTDILSGFVSRIGINKQKKYIHIIYDRGKINNYSEERSDKSAYYSKVFLHELGHVRQEKDVDWFLDKIYKENSSFVLSDPFHEYGAWVYAITVRMILSSIRSWLSRFMDDDDPEWKTCC